MAMIQDEAAQSARYWSSWLRILGFPTWQEVLKSDARVLGMRWQVLSTCVSFALVGGNYGVETTAKTSSLLLVAGMIYYIFPPLMHILTVLGFVGSGFLTVGENIVRAIYDTTDFSEQSSPNVYHMGPTISIQTTPIIASDLPGPTENQAYQHPHGEIR